MDKVIEEVRTYDDSMEKVFNSCSRCFWPRGKTYCMANKFKLKKDEFEKRTCLKFKDK